MNTIRAQGEMNPIRKLTGRVLQKVARMIDPPRIDIYIEDDDYVTQLTYMNAGIMARGNPYLFEYAISRLPSSAPILEIGSYCGLSTNLLIHYTRKYNAPNAVISCDRWEFQKSQASLYVGESKLLYADLEQFARESYIRNIKKFSSDKLPFTFELNSDEFFAAWQARRSAADILERNYELGGPLSFCFIDGNHTYEYVKRDFLNCDAFLEVGGFILFDDSTSLKDDVRLVMPEVLATGRYNLAAKNPYHLFQKTQAR